MAQKKKFLDYDQTDTTRMSVAEARKIMGKDANDMTDEEVDKLIDQLSGLARAYIRDVQSGRLDPVAATKEIREKQKADAEKLAELTYDIYKADQEQSSKKI